MTRKRKRPCEPFWLGDLPLVVLCIKLWSVHGGGTVRVSKCIILAFLVAKAPKRAEKGPNCVPYSPKMNENLAKGLVQGVCAHPGCCKKLLGVLKIACYNPQKWSEMDVFTKTHL
jgi:hypothetical protein